jgi:serine/threonine-protein kinase
MKHYPLGSLDNYLLNRNNQVNKSLVTHFISDIASGIQALHQNHLAHSDIKTANVLIDTDEEGYAFCVLTDFGITQVLSLNMVAAGFNITNIRGLSYSYASPEAFVRQKAQGRLTDKPEVFKAGDVYSLGCILYELMTRKCPWN